MQLRTVMLAVAAAGAIAAPASAATWEPPVALSNPVTSTDGLQLAAGSDGRVLAVWSYRSGVNSGVAAASRRPDGRWGPTRRLGTWTPVTGAPARATGVGASLTVAAYGADRWLGLGIVQRHGFEEAVTWWKGTTTGAAHRGGVLAETPWEGGRVAAFPDGSAVIAYTTMRPRRGAGSNLRPRVVVAAHGSQAGFGATRRLSPLPPGPPYGNNLGPALSATDVTVAAGGRGTVVVAWQRVGRIEARVSRDRGRTYGPVRYLGPSPEAFPSLTAGVSASGKVLVVCGAREMQGPARVLVASAAIAAPGKGFATRVLERSAPLDLSAPLALDQRGPPTLAGFDREVPFAAWQTVVGGRSAVRTARLEGEPMTTTFAEPDEALLDDVTTARSGPAAIAWRTVDAIGHPGNGFVAQAPAGGPFGAALQLPSAAGATGIRLAYDPQGLLAAWSVRSGATSTVLAAQVR
jgi:hypothetical protein